MSAPELKPCPFCGGKKLYAEYNEFGGLVVLCANCEAHGPSSEADKEQILAAWNTRADLCNPTDERVKELEAENARLRGALSIYADVVSNYASESELASDPAYDWLQEDGGDVACAALRDMGVEAKMKTSEEIGRAFEEDAGQLRAKLEKLTKAANRVHDSYWNSTDGIIVGMFDLGEALRHAKDTTL